MKIVVATLLAILPSAAIAGGGIPNDEFTSRAGRRGQTVIRQAPGNSSSSAGSDSRSQAQGAANNIQETAAASTSVGGNNINNSYFTEFGKSSWYQFSEKAVRCEGPRFSAGIWADPGSQYYNYGRYRQDEHDLRGAIAVTIPFGGERVICQSMARELEKRMKFDTQKGQLGACVAMTKAGTKFTPELIEVLPALKICADIASKQQ